MIAMIDDTTITIVKIKNKYKSGGPASLKGEKPFLFSVYLFLL